MINLRPIFALFEQSLRADMRAGWIATARTVLLVVLLFALTYIQQLAGRAYFSAPGLHFFQTIAWTSLIGITLSGFSYFAAVITEDKEDKTLGLLRMTDLSPVAILLGKSTGRLVTACLCLAMTIPFLLLAVTLGGVGLRQIGATYLCLLSYLILVANIGLLWSVIFARTASASGMTLFTFIIIFAFPPVIGAIAGEFINTKYWIAPYCPGIKACADAMLSISPFVALARVLSTAFNGPLLSLQVLTSLAIAAGCFGLAWSLFDVCNRSEKESIPIRLTWRKRMGLARRVPAGVIGPTAVTWKDWRYLGGGSLGIASRVIGTLVIIGICLFTAYKADGLRREVVGGFFIFIPLVVAALNLVMDTERTFSEEVKGKTLSSLMTLPFTPQRIAWMKAMYPLRTTLPVFALVGIGILIVPGETGEAISSLFSDGDAVVIFLLMILNAVTFLYLTALLAIFVKRGAAMLALLLFYAGGMMLGFLTAMLSLVFSMGYPGREVLMLPLFAMLITAIAVMHRAIPLSLARKACE